LSFDLIFGQPSQAAARQASLIFTLPPVRNMAPE
jgi:hypothetical protein